MTDRSYRALFALRGMTGLTVCMTLGRVASSMMTMALTLLALTTYRSPALAGLVTVALVVPGLVVAPVAGALLDRYGRVRLVAINFVVGTVVTLLIGGLSGAGLLSQPWLLVLASVSSLTSPLANSGLRTLLPLLAPPYLWERANAVDSASWVLSTLVGPPVAGALAMLLGPPGAIGVVALIFSASLATTRWVVEAERPEALPGRLLANSLAGLTYVLRNPSLFGLAVSVTLVNFAGGVLSVGLPVVVLGEGVRGTSADVGVLFALQGLGGLLGAIVFGRRDSRNRERAWLGWSEVATGLLALLLLVGHGLPALAAMMFLAGLATGPLDLGMYTLRQRRTHPDWMGRSFAISAALNFAGFPIGAAVAGAMAASHLTPLVLLTVAMCLLAGVAAWRLIPARAPEPGETAAAPIEA